MTFALPEFKQGAYAGKNGRKLRLEQTRVRGADVFTLQSLLDGVLDLDGILGPKTDAAIRNAQSSHGLVVDGWAGEKTLLALQSPLLSKVAVEVGVDPNRLYGQVEHETSFMGGIRSDEDYSDGSHDAGPVQENTGGYTLDHAYHAGKSFRELAGRIKSKHAEYVRLGKVSDRRAWDLAQGSWNAPSWTDRLARGQKLGADQSKTIEAYIAAVSKYVP